MANNGHIVPRLKFNCFLILAISLGHEIIDINTLFSPSNYPNVLQSSITLFSGQLRKSIDADKRALTPVLSALKHLDPFLVMKTGELGFLWLTQILNSTHPENEHYPMAGQVIQSLEHHFHTEKPERLNVDPTWIPPLVRVLSLSGGGSHIEDFWTPARTLISRILPIIPASPDFHTTILPLLNAALSPSHSLQLRCPALKLILRFTSQWLLIEDVPDEFGDLLRAVGDPFQPAPPPLEGLLHAIMDPFQPTPGPPLDNKQFIDTTRYDPTMVMATLIGFALSDRLRHHLHTQNFITCEEIVATQEGKTKFKHALDTSYSTWPKPLLGPDSLARACLHLVTNLCPVTALVVEEWAAIRELQGERYPVSARVVDE